MHHPKSSVLPVTRKPWFFHLYTEKIKSLQSKFILPIPFHILSAAHEQNRGDNTHGVSNSRLQPWIQLEVTRYLKSDGIFD